MIKIGAITIDVSHPKVFSEIVAEGDRAKYVAVFNDGFRGNDELEAFAEKMDLKICNSLEELADIVDVGFVHCCNWDKHLDYVKPFIERGKPVFIDKPVVGNIDDIKKLEELCSGGAKIIGTSALRYCEEAVNIKAEMKEDNALPLHTIVTVGADDFNYAIHAVELICGINEARPVSCRHLTSSEVDGKTCDNYFVTFENGTTAQYVSVIGKFVKFHTTVISTSADATKDHCFEVDTGKFYKAMLDNVCDYMENKPNTIATCEQMCDAIKIMLAGKASKKHGDVEVSLDSPLLKDGAFDGYEFEKGYAAKGRKIFL